MVAVSVLIEIVASSQESKIVGYFTPDT